MYQNLLIEQAVVSDYCIEKVKFNKSNNCQSSFYFRIGNTLNSPSLYSIMLKIIKFKQILKYIICKYSIEYKWGYAFYIIKIIIKIIYSYGLKLDNIHIQVELILIFFSNSYFKNIYSNSSFISI